MENIKFELNEVETKSAHDWIEEHKKVCPHSFKNNNLPATGEHFYFKIIPGGLGYIVKVGCIYCEIEEDITDISCW